MYSSTCS